MLPENPGHFEIYQNFGRIRGQHVVEFCCCSAFEDC